MAFGNYIRRGAFGEITFLDRRYYVEKITNYDWPERRQVIELEDVATGEVHEMTHEPMNTDI